MLHDNVIVKHNLIENLSSPLTTLSDGQPPFHTGLCTGLWDIKGIGDNGSRINLRLLLENLALISYFTKSY